jgi:hypothetical protein
MKVHSGSMVLTLLSSALLSSASFGCGGDTSECADGMEEVEGHACSTLSARTSSLVVDVSDASTSDASKWGPAEDAARSSVAVPDPDAVTARPSNPRPTDTSAAPPAVALHPASNPRPVSSTTPPVGYPVTAPGPRPTPSPGSSTPAPSGVGGLPGVTVVSNGGLIGIQGYPAPATTSPDAGVTSGSGGLPGVTVVSRGGLIGVQGVHLAN